MLTQGTGRTRSMFTAALALLTLATLCLPASAEVREWTGQADQDWFNVLNWTPSGTPAPSDDLRINTGAAQTEDVFVSDGGWLRAANAGTLLSTTHLCIGDAGTGWLSIASGAQITSTRSAELGRNVGTTGVATVSGANSRWAPGLLYVGFSGSGAVTIDAGAEVSSLHGVLGYNTGSVGAVTVTGTGSRWTNSFDLVVGRYGSGTVTVSDGGVVSTRSLYGSMNDLLGNGAITVTGGTVLDTALAFDLSHGLHQMLAFGTGGVLNLSLDGTGAMGAGYKGAGSLRIADGRSITSSSGTLGYEAGSSGIAVVSGTNSQWTINGPLYVGRSGNGELTIEDGGQVVTTDRYGSTYLGHSVGSSGTATVRGADSRWTNASTLYVGRGGDGTLNIEAGGQVSNTTGYLGYAAGSSGTVTVRGADSKWTNASILFVGGYGDASLLVESGGQVSSSVAQIGNYGQWPHGEKAVATVTGAGSRWTTDVVIVGGAEGRLNIRDGGQVSSQYGQIGNYPQLPPGSEAKTVATVTGTGSTWTSLDSLILGGIGPSLTVADGAKVLTQHLQINSRAAVNLHVSGNDMLVLGNSTTAGCIDNRGAVNFYADAFLAGGLYRPISEYAGRTITWDGDGSYNDVGGIWIDSYKVFVVDDAAQLQAGSVHQLVRKDRLIVTDAGTGRRMGVSFGDVASGNFRADLMTDAALSGLALTSGFEGDVLAGWSIISGYTGGEVMLSFDVGLGKDSDSLCAWRLADGAWAECDPALATYDSHGIYSFTASGFSGYAVVHTPEPATLGLLVTGGLALLSRRRK